MPLILLDLVHQASHISLQNPCFALFSRSCVLIITVTKLLQQSSTVLRLLVAFTRAAHPNQRVSTLDLTAEFESQKHTLL